MRDETSAHQILPVQTHSLNQIIHGFLSSGFQEHFQSWHCI